MKLTLRTLFLSIMLFAVNSLLADSGTFRNPVIPADYSDPDAIRVGDDYYLTASSFANAPGMPILHSRDLVNWEIVNHAVKRVPPYDFYDAAPRHGKGIWAPSIRFHNNKYYIYWGDPDFGIFMITADDPRGEWSEPVLVKGGKGMIDPVPLWDEDGKVYLAHAWAGSRIGFNSVITVCELNPEGTEVISDPVMVFDGNDGINHTIEGPKLYKHDGWYYIFSPAGGVVEGWQLVMRSKNIFGPYEAKIVMSQGSTDINGPHQGAWVDTPEGDHWFLHFQDRGLYGRVLHLNPMKWVDGWPVIGEDTGRNSGAGEPMRVCPTPFKGTRQANRSIIVDDFSSPRLAGEWEWAANYHDSYGLPTNQGFFRLYSHILPTDSTNLWEVPNLLVQKYPAEAFTVTAKVKISAKGNSDGILSGLLLFGMDYGYIALRKDAEGFSLVEGICKDADKGGREELTLSDVKIPSRSYEAGLFPNLESEIWLRAEVARGGEARFSYSLDGKKFHNVGILFQSRQGKWVGAKVGFFSTAPAGNERGWMDIDRVETRIN